MTRKVIDWEAVEIQYRAGIRSLKEIGAEFNVSDAAIIKRAKRDGWSRDLRAKIKAKAEAKVSAASVSAEVSAQTKATERQVVEANAEAIARIRLAHRADISRGRDLALKLLRELEAATDDPELFEQLGELLEKPDEKGRDKLNELYHKAISMPGRIGSLKSLADTLKTLVGLEREAWGLAAEQDKPPAEDPADIPSNDLARRIAFALTKGLKKD